MKQGKNDQGPTKKKRVSAVAVLLLLCLIVFIAVFVWKSMGAAFDGFDTATVTGIAE